MLSDTETSSAIAEPARTKWPTVWGWLGIVWGSLGLLGICCMGASLFWSASSATEGNPVPTAMKIEMLVGGVLGLGIGILLLSAAIALLRRRQKARRLVLMYVTCALIMAPVQLVMGMVGQKAKDEYQRRQWSDQIDEMERQGQKPPQFFKDMANGTSNPTKWIAPTCIGLASLFPLIMGLYIIPKREEMSRWP